ncbi:phosphonate C-P lyase system protein PhnL [Oleidesulfovibrio sp.]|uniref:phosphonate C-P lyase system protein PhnL n=1 Tax=Oleidesulfovibrio sp. TaxID=2909707 RepID=UPI003A843667
MTVMIEVSSLSKRFVLHNQGGAQLQVFEGLNLAVSAGECVALHGRSGSGKSTLLRSLYANYKPVSGAIRIRHKGEMVDIASADPRLVVQVRKHTVGYVSQFLRAIPRVPTFELVAAARRELTGNAAEAEVWAAELLGKLNIPHRLWSLAPATFSGGEQQRVNIARGFAVDYPVMLLDEPTASLDAANRAVVVELIRETKARGAAVVGIFHDDEVREAVADRVHTMIATEQVA